MTDRPLTDRPLADRPLADRPLDRALDALPASGGTVTVDRGAGSSAEVDVTDVDRIGVRIREVRVHRERAVDVEAESYALPDRVRSLPDRLVPVEVAPSLGGGRLRSRPDELRGREFFEIDVAPQRTTVRRTRVEDDGDRAPAEWTMTREQLDRLIGETAGD